MAAAKTFSLSYAMTLLTGSSGSSEAMKWLEPSVIAARAFSLSCAIALLTGSSGSSEAMKWLEPSMTGPTRLSWIPAALMTEDRSLWRENPWLVS